MPTQMLTSLGAASAADRLTVVMTRAAHLAVPAAQRPRDDDLAPVHPPDGPHLHAVGQRQPVGADPRRRDRPPRRPDHDPVEHGRGRLLVGPAARRPPGHRVGHARRQPRDGLAARAGLAGPGRLHADLRPGQAADAQPASTMQVIADGRHSVPTAMTITSGSQARQRDAAAHRRRHGARARSRRCRSPSPPLTGSALRRHLHRRPAGVRGQLLLGRPARRCRWASRRSASPACRRTRRRPRSPGNCVSNLLTIDGQPIDVAGRRARPSTRWTAARCSSSRAGPTPRASP